MSYTLSTTSYGDILRVEEKAEKRLVGFNSEVVDYRMVTYLKYDFGCFADEAKKVLEKNLVENYLSETFTLGMEHVGTSLDIGCATGRYPTWLATIGFEAHGYDIEEGAIRICEERASHLPDVHFEKRNIVEDGVIPNKFDLVTCMMGTFNHIPSNDQTLFLERIAETLKPGGKVVFSSWNPECSYTNYLQFYTRKEREYLRENAPSSEKIKKMLEEAGLELEAIEPFMYLPDECYHAWEAETELEDAIRIDSQFRQTLSARNSQMYLVIAGKKMEE